MADLTCVCCYFNPANFRVHAEKYRRFAAHMRESGVRLVTVECVFPTGRVLPTGETVWQEFQVTNPGHPDHVQVLGRTPLWVKENLLNLGWARCQTTNVMWSDTDIHFEDPRWVESTIEHLQIYSVVQPFSLLVHCAPDGRPLFQQHMSLAKYTTKIRLLPSLPNVKMVGDGRGGAYAFRRDALDQMGGLFDEHILGDGDDVLSFGLSGQIQQCIRDGAHPRVFDHLVQWTARLQGLSFMSLRGIANHQWHGPLSARGYDSRWKILIEEHFNPETDLYRNEHGVWECTNVGINQRIAAYFVSRQEDALK